MEPTAADEASAEPKRPFLERVGLRYLRNQAEKMPRVVAMDEIHVLNPDEQRELRRIERAMIGRAALIGALSALCTAAAELVALPWFGIDPEDTSVLGLVKYYGLVFGVTGVATGFEIAFLYWDALRSVHALARAAGLHLFDEEDDAESQVATALARAALELPNPPRSLETVDPYREVSRIRLVLIAVAYKLKIGVTSFLLKALVRRLMGRAVLRVYLVLIGVPVTAAWNAIVAWWVIREARLRVIGPSAAIVYTDAIFRSGAELSDVGRRACLRAVACSIVRTHDVHPNLVAFYREVSGKVGDPGGVPIDDTAEFLLKLSALPDDEQDIVLQILAVAAVLDGRVTRDERKLLVEAWSACGREPARVAVAQLRRRFATGSQVDVDLLTEVASRNP